MKMTRCATLLAKPISWVTTIMVMPSRARSTMTSSTSEIISGSSAEVGSSNSMAIGSIASARAMATRCCWPPDNSAGYLRACSFSPTRSSSLAPFAIASSCDRPSTFSCARQRFSMIFRCGKSSKCWNTMPTRARSFSRSVLRSLTLMPSRMISPLWNGSSALTHLINVDFPDPDGPHTTTTSPLATLVVQSFSAWNAGPYHLSTWLISIMRFSLTDNTDTRLKAPDAERCGAGNCKIDRSREQIHLHQPAVALRDLAGGAQKSRNRQHVDQRGVLEQHDGLRQQHREHVPERLRQHDVTHGLAVGQTQRLRRRGLAIGDRLDAGALYFGKICRLEHDEGDERRGKRADTDRPRRARQPLPDIGHQEIEPEDHQHQRQRPHQVDIEPGDPPEEFQARQPHQCEQRAEDQAAQRCQARQRQRERHAVEKQISERAADNVEVEAGKHRRGSLPGYVAGDRYCAFEQAHRG